MSQLLLLPRLVLSLLAALLPAVAWVTVPPYEPGYGLTSAAVVGDHLIFATNHSPLSVERSLYSRPLAGGSPRLLTWGLPEGALAGWGASADRIILDWWSNKEHLLYSVPIAGGMPLRLHPPHDAPKPSDPTFFSSRLAGDRVVYAVYQERPAVAVLYSVPVRGGPITRLSLNLPDPTASSAWSVDRFDVSGDGATVAYTMVQKDLSTGSMIDDLLFVTSTAGGASLLISDPVEPPSRAVPLSLTNDGSRVVYLAVGATQDEPGLKLVSAATDGSGRVELASARAISFSLTLDGAYVVYVARPGPFGDAGVLRSAPVEGGQQLVLAYSVGDEHWVSPEGEVYFTPVAGGLQHVPATGGAPQMVLGAEYQLSFPPQLEFGADGWVAFVGGQGLQAMRLFSYHLGDSGAVPLTGDLQYLSLTKKRAFSDGRVLYTAADNGGQPLLYSVPRAGGQPVQISGAYEDNERVLTVFGVIGKQVLYGMGNPALHSGQRAIYPRLFLAPVDGSTPPIRVPTQTLPLTPHIFMPVMGN